CKLGPTHIEAVCVIDGIGVTGLKQRYAVVSIAWAVLYSYDHTRACNNRDRRAVAVHRQTWRASRLHRHRRAHGDLRRTVLPVAKHIGARRCGQGEWQRSASARNPREPLMS